MSNSNTSFCSTELPGSKPKAHVENLYFTTGIYNSRLDLATGKEEVHNFFVMKGTD